MIVPDLNLLVYAFNSDAAAHRKASAWWEDCLNAEEQVGVPWLVLAGFLRLLSGKTVVKNPFPIRTLFEITEEWFDLPHVSLVEPTQRTYDTMRRLMVDGSLPGSLVTDAFIASTALEYDATLYTNDTDFTRFTGLKLRNPLLN